jgi:hypothetical protein
VQSLADMETLCSHCQVRTAEPGSLAWYSYIPMLLFGMHADLDQYCAECAAGRNFLALLIWVPAGAVAFVLAVLAFT